MVEKVNSVNDNPIKIDDINETAFNELSKELKVNKYLLRMLIDRGYNDLDSIRLFLYGDKNNLLSPYYIPNIDKAAEVINKAIKANKRICVYGDYDCDGICAISILKLFFKEKGIDIDYYIPDRNNEGYGLNLKALSDIIYEYKPELLITVDCGISSVKEIEYLKESGVEVIVTDHHELPVVLPDCIVVNGKLSEDKRFHDMCGTFVVLKLVEAMSDRDYAMQFCDIAAIATVADMVPLTNDNRIIVKEGLKLINNINKRLGLSLLIQKCKLKNDIKSNDIAFIIAPHINSAGRVGKAYEVVELFCSKDYFTVDTLTDKLIKSNSIRQDLCDKIYKDAIELLNQYDFSLRIIALFSEEWETGLIGITAAKLTNEFNRPVVLFSKKDDLLKGSARSYGDINIYEALSVFKDNYLSFGGHSQACGLTLETAKFNDFLKNVNDYLNNNYNKDSYIAKNNYDYEIDENILDLDVIKEFNLLEPFGMSNLKPLFRMVQKMKFDRLYSTDHIKYIYNKSSIIGFNMINSINILNSDSVIAYCVDLGINEYKNNQTVQAVIRHYDILSLDKNTDAGFLADYYKQLLYGKADSLDAIELNDYNEVLSQLNDYGTLIVTYSIDNYKKLNDFLNANNMGLRFFVNNKNNLNPENLICFAPSDNYDFNFYKKVIFLERPLSAKIINNLIKKDIKVYFVNTILSTRDIIINNLLLNSLLLEIAELINSGIYFNSIDTLYKYIIKHKISSLTFKICFFILYEQKAISVDSKFNLKIERLSINYSKSQYRSFFKEDE